MDLLTAAQELCKLERTKVRIRATNEVATIIPPGSFGNYITLRINKTGKQTRLRPKEVDLIEILKPKKSAPMVIGAQCGLCNNNAATSKCSECGIPICTQECSLANWKKVHRACRIRRKRRNFSTFLVSVFGPSRPCATMVGRIDSLVSMPGQATGGWSLRRQRRGMT